MRRVLAPTLLAFATCAITASAAAQTAPAAPGTPATTATSPAKKELVQRLMRLQQSEVEGFARAVVERPAAQMMREAGMALQQQAAPQEKREAAARAIEAEIKKYVDEAYPIVRERALRLAPSTIGAVYEAKMTDDELRQLIAWLESPTAKKYQSLATELRNNFSQKLVSEMPPILDPKLMALDGRVRTILGLPPAGTPPAPSPPARPASR
jgi:hypothetical protein